MKFSASFNAGIVTVSLCLLAVVSKSQNVPVTPPVSTLGAYTPPATYSDPTTVNYVRSWTARAPLTAPAAGDLSDKLKYGEATAYFDGLGRPLQEVVRAANPDGTKDIVSVHVYDDFGREAQQFLPFPIVADNNTSSSTYNTEGRYKKNPFTTQGTFYNTAYGGDKRPYSQIDFEASPLNRPLTAFAPGNSWMGSKGTATEHATRSSYEINVAGEVIQWNIGNSAGDIPLKENDPSNVDKPYYAAGQLYRNVTTDEHNNRVVEYKDKEGHVILKKVELPPSTTPPITPSTVSSHTGWLCTYYVYDDFGLLRFVIPPKATEWLNNNNWTFPTGGGDVGAELCFRYEYDSRNRMVVKKVPGKGEEWMVYDKRDRLAMTQDAKLRLQGRWQVTQYDELNRPLRTYLWTNSDPRTTHETNASASSTPVDYPVMTSGYTELLTETYYDNYAWISGSGSSLSNSMDGGQVTSDFLTASNNASPYPQSVTPDYATKGMVTGTKVEILGTANYLYTVTFYDDRGRVVQVQSTNDGGGTDIITNQYSFDGKVLITKQNHKASASATPLIVYSRMSYDHMGRLLKVVKQLGDAGGQSTPPNQTETAYNTQPITIVENEYDDLGKLKNKKLGRTKDEVTTTYTTNPLETLSYNYNIRGWLSGINRGYVNPARYYTEAFSQQNRWFGMELAYDEGFSTNQFNGNIAGTIWRSQGDGDQRAYGFAYDGANRLLKGDFTQWGRSTSTWDNSDGVDYSMKMGDGITPASAYDLNGNILSMWQKGYKAGSSATPSANSPVIDNLAYSYYTNTNKLQTVTDQSGSTNNHLGDFTDGNTSGDDYGYDPNGNLVADKNKGIRRALGGGEVGLNLGSGLVGVLYNHLNLPTTVRLVLKGYITFVYDALGNKLRKTVVDASGSTTKTTTTYYMGGFVYEQIDNGPVELQYFGHEEGRVRLAKKQYLAQTGTFCAEEAPPIDDDAPPSEPIVHCFPIYSAINYTAFEFDYFIKDHLGNIRAVLTDELQKDFYPAATLEGNINDITTAVSVEKDYYAIDPANIVTKSLGCPGYYNQNGIYNPNPKSDVSGFSRKMYRLNGSNASAQKGLDIVLKVTAGDHFDIFGNSYNNATNDSYGTPTSSISFLTLLTGLLTGSGGIANSASHATASALESSAGTSGDLGAFQLLQRSQASSTIPLASINWILFDDQFRIVDKGVSMVGGAGTLKKHYLDAILQNIAVTKNGYLYVYCSNESAVNIDFDNLQVVHTRGPLLEETHYYPFGLTMQGISSKATGKLENKRLFNAGSELQNKEFSDGSGLELYATNFRSLDPQLGRWWQIDPKPDYAQSLYSSMDNNPILKNDPLGDLASETKSSLLIPSLTGRIIAVIPVTIINVTGVVKDMTKNKSMTTKQLTDAATRINNGIRTAYTGFDKKGRLVIANPQITSGMGMMGPLPIKKDDHVFSFYDANNVPNPDRALSTFTEGTTGGAALPGQKGIALSIDLLNHFPATEGPNAGTGISADNNNTVERTSAHEFGHTLLGRGHGYPTNNLMLQSTNQKAGMKLTSDQFETIHKNIDNSNGPTQIYP